jgi:hypothetical protein
MRPIIVLLLTGLMTTTASAQTAPLAGPPGAPPSPPSASPPGLSQGTPPAAPPSEQLRAIEPLEVRLLWANRRWQLAHRGEVLKDFGPREQDARQALRVIQELRLNQHGVIGSPMPVMEYWLADGKPPHAAPRGSLRTVDLNPATLRVEQVQGQWCLRDAARVLFNFQQHADDARQALAVVRKYHFDQFGVVGSVTPMYVPMSHSESDSPTSATAPGRQLSPRQLLTSPFARATKNEGPSRADAGKSPAAAAKPAAPAAGREEVVRQVLPPLADAPRDAGTAQPPGSPWRTHFHVPGQEAAHVDSDRIAFDWRQVQLRQQQGEWKLMAGGTVLGNFGDQVREAKLALAALRYYRFTEQWRLGVPQPYITYYVPNRTAPPGLMLGISGEELKADKLELRHVETGYALCQGQRVVFRLREREDDGRRLLDAIKQSHCDRICRIGEPGKEPMTLLLRSK